MADQFGWTSGHDETGHVYLVDLSGVMALLLFICDDICKFETISALGVHIFVLANFFITVRVALGTPGRRPTSFNGTINVQATDPR